MLTLVLIAHTREWEQGSIDVLIQVLQDRKVRTEVVKKKKSDRKGRCTDCERTSSPRCQHPQRELTGHC